MDAIIKSRTWVLLREIQVSDLPRVAMMLADETIPFVFSPLPGGWCDVSVPDESLLRAEGRLLSEDRRWAP